jgi:hypothetical protein
MTGTLPEKYCCGNDGKVSKSDNLYSKLTGVNPKRYYLLMGNTVFHIAIKRIRGIKWE